MRIAHLLLLFTVIVWGWTFVATRICLEYLSPVELLGMRILIGLPILGLLLLLNRTKLQFKPYLKQLALASVIITAHFLVQITGLKYTSATNTGWIIAISPLITVALSFIFLREHVGRYVIIGIVLASVGVLMLISKGQVSNFGWLSSVGDWLVLVSAHTWAFYTIITRDISRACDPLAVTFVILIPPGALTWGIILTSSPVATFTALPLRAIAALLFLGVLGTALGHWFWQRGLAEIGAARAGIFLYLEPFATTMLAVPYLHEYFGISTAIGGLLVLTGVWLSQRTRLSAPQE